MDTKSVLGRLESLVGPATIRYPDNVEVSRKHLRVLLDSAKTLDYIRADPRLPRRLYWMAVQALAPLTTPEHENEEKLAHD